MKPEEFKAIRLKLGLSRSKYYGSKDTPLARLHRKLDKSSECWLWTGACSSNGYGHIYFQGRIVPAHRLAYQLHVGEIPRGLWVLHRCDVKRCCKPEHLFIGNRHENIADMVSKKRSAPALSVLKTKLSDLQILTIKRILAQGLLSRVDIANIAGVHPQTLHDIEDYDPSGI